MMWRAGAIVLALFAVAGRTWAADGLEARLAAAEDRAAIEKLVTGDYPRALDQRNWKEYAALFTADGALTMRTTTVTGPAEIEKYFVNFRSPSASGPPPKPGEIRTLHVVTNLSFRIEGNTATGGAYWQTIGLSGGRTAVLSAGHYEDVLRKQGGQWKFAKRAIVSDLAPPPAATPAATGAPATNAPSSSSEGAQKKN
jgi:3-phenylpropionate/cinnamic acid dioxygenase small subunit